MPLKEDVDQILYGNSCAITSVWFELKGKFDHVMRMSQTEYGVFYDMIT